eukprot:SAG31_NODE_11279_length_1046_cov_1.804646_1_plen_256_part_10
MGHRIASLRGRRNAVTNLDSLDMAAAAKAATEKFKEAGGQTADSENQARSTSSASSAATSSSHSRSQALNGAAGSAEHNATNAIDASRQTESTVISTMMAQLARLRLSEMQQRAAAFGMAADKIEEAVEEAENPRDALLQLLEEAVRDSHARNASRAQELRRLPLSALRRTATAVGIAHAVVDETVELADNPKAALVQLILEAVPAAGVAPSIDAAVAGTDKRSAAVYEYPGQSSACGANQLSAIRKKFRAASYTF